jgi:hypothetical protein
MKNKYEQLVRITTDEIGPSHNITADILETLVYKGEILEEDIDMVVNESDDTADIIYDIIAIATTYIDFVDGYCQDESENDQ